MPDTRMKRAMELTKDISPDDTSNRPVTRARSRLRTSSLGSIPRVLIHPGNVTTPPPRATMSNHTLDSNDQEEEGFRVEIEDVEDSDDDFHRGFHRLEQTQPGATVVLNKDKLPFRAVVPDPVVIPVMPALVAAALPPVVEPAIPVVEPRKERLRIGPAAIEDQIRIREIQAKVAKLHKEARRLLQDCQEFVDVSEHVIMNPVTLEFIDREAKRLTDKIDNMYSKLDDTDDTRGLDRELDRWKPILRRFVVSAMNKVHVPTPPVIVPAQPTALAQVPQQTRRDRSPESLDMVQSDLEYFMAKLRPSIMPDASYGTLLSNSELRELHDVTMPQVSKAIDE